MAIAAAGSSTRTTILEVARRQFAQHGFAATRLNDIADEVGIRRPSLLHHFPSKEALYREVVVDSFADWIHLVEAATTTGARNGWQRVEIVMRSAFRFFE